MKKQIGIIIGTLIIVLIAYVGITYSSQPATKENGDISKPPVVYEEINVEQYREMIENQATFTVYIGRPDCSTCDQFKPTLDTFLSNHRGGTLYYFNTKSIRDASKEENNDQAAAFYEAIREEFSFKWTPTINHYDQGILKDTFQFLDEDYYNVSSADKKASIVEKESAKALRFLTKHVTN